MTEQREVWRDVVGFEGDYIVSNLGHVMSLPRRANHVYGSRISEGRILAPSIVNGGYLVVAMCKDGARTTRLVHRLVAEAFIPNPNHLEQVNHKNFDRQCNTVDNLEWCTASENALYSERAGRLHHGNKPIIRDDGEMFDSIAEAARAMGIDSTTIVVALTRTRADGGLRTAGGHTFRYAEGAA